jgi:hypothetical protein
MITWSQWFNYDLFSLSRVLLSYRVRNAAQALDQTEVQERPMRTTHHFQMPHQAHQMRPHVVATERLQRQKAVTTATQLAVMAALTPVNWSQAGHVRLPDNRVFRLLFAVTVQSVLVKAAMTAIHETMTVAAAPVPLKPAGFVQPPASPVNQRVAEMALPLALKTVTMAMPLLATAALVAV